MKLLTRKGTATAAEAMARSIMALDAPLPGDAELTVLELTSEATVLGAFQRHHGAALRGEVLRRVSGGPAVTVGPGTIHLLLALTHPAALVACDPRRIVNRYVRPLLRAVTREGALAHYFGRDWVSVSHMPVGEVGFAHDSRTKRAVFEAFVAVSYPFASGPRASFRDKTPSTLASATGRSFDVASLVARIEEAYAGLAFEVAPASRDRVVVEPLTWGDPPWAASETEAIGEVAAGPDASGTLRLGGDLLASRDALERVAARVAALALDVSSETVGRIVDEELTAGGVGLDGVRDLTHVRDVLVRARASMPRSLP
jgi:hypothetical protein